MSAVEDRLREGLRLLADEMRPIDLAAGVVARGRRARRRRTTIAVVAAGAAVAAIVTPLSLAGGGSRSDETVTPTPAATSLDPSHGGADPEFEVAAPDNGHSGPPPPQLPACRPTSVQGTAQLRPTVGGVVGVVFLSGEPCQLYDAPGPIGLLDRDGHRLDIPVESRLPGDGLGRDLRGTAAWGFAWRGSWCGPAAAAIELSLGHGFRPLVVPLTGPSPDCAAVSRSTLVVGLVDAAGQPVQTSPPAWSSLRARLIAPARTDGIRVYGLRLRLSNPTSQPIVLSPCPNYSFIVTRHQRGGLLSNGGGGALACHEPPAVVPAYGSVTFDLPDQFSNARNGDEPIKGSLVEVEVLFPGGPTATAMLHVG